jgi:hypothetical protein
VFGDGGSTLLAVYEPFGDGEAGTAKPAVVLPRI